MTSILYKICKSEKFPEVRKIFKEVDETKLSTAPPRGPIVKNSIFVYPVHQDTQDEYWRHDGFSFKSRRSITWPQKKGRKQWCRRRTSQLLSGGEAVNFFRYEYYPIGCELNPPNLWEIPYVVVIYEGTFPLDSWEGRRHGNRKDTPNKNENLFIRGLLADTTPVKDDPILSGMKCEKSSMDSPQNWTSKEDRKEMGTPDQEREISASAQTEIFSIKKEPPTLHASDISRVETFESSALSRNDAYFSVTNDSDIPANGKDSLMEEVSASAETVIFPRKSGPSITQEIVLQKPKDDSPPTPGHRIDSSSSSPNEKLQREVHSRMNPCVKRKTLQNLEASVGPTQAFRNVQRQSILENGDDQPTLIPRNSKQAHNLQYQRRKENHHDDIFELYLLAKTSEDILLKVDLIPEVIVVQAHTELTKHFTSLQRLNDTFILHYDTTFEVGKYFTSILSMRHKLFKGQPVVPLAVMFHETTSEVCHDTFFRVMSERFGMDSSQVIIVTDREKSITNAIKNNIPMATHLFCWNHMRRNIGQWMKTRLPGKCVNVYKEQVLALLRSQSEEDFDDQLKILKKEWDASFTKYFTKYINQDILSSYRPILESLGIYSDSSGITNNVAESSNAAFKRLTDSKNSSLFQICSIWYYYQVDFLYNIFRGIKNQGNFKPFQAVPKKVYRSEVINDVVDRNLIFNMVYQGKISGKLQTTQVYKSVSLLEKTTLRGLAQYYVNRGSVTLCPNDGVFVVTGRLNKKFTVDLRLGSCTCARPSNCEHRLAALISTGMDQKVQLKRCQPNIGDLYKKKIRKTTGKKAGQGIRRNRLRISNSELLKDCGKTVVKIQNPNLNKTSSTLSSGSKREFATPEEDHGLGSFQKKARHEDTLAPSFINEKWHPPKLSTDNFRNTFLSLPSGNISYAEITSLKPTHTRLEKQIILDLVDNEEEFANPDWLPDSVVSGFLTNITELTSSQAVAITASESKYIFQGEDASLLFSNSDMDAADYYDWKNVRTILVPYIQDNNHWIMLILLASEKLIKVIDPLGRFKLPENHKNILETLFNPKFFYDPNETWHVEYPNAALSLGNNTLQCGPFICFYGEASVKGWSLESMPNVVDYRNHIAHTIVGNCKIRSKRVTSRCLECSKEVMNNECCDFCKRSAHLECLRVDQIRGRTYYFCP